jgi:hypothetical protein
VPGRNFSTVCKLLLKRTEKKGTVPWAEEDSPLFFRTLLALSVLLLGADRAMAYGGPGVDVTFISYAMTLLAWALAAFSATLLWPVYALLRWIRSRQKKSTMTSTIEPAPEAARGLSHTDS